MPVAGGYCFAEAFGYALAIRLRFHKHDSQWLSSYLGFHQQAADELGGDSLRGAGNAPCHLIVAEQQIEGGV